MIFEITSIKSDHFRRNANIWVLVYQFTRRWYITQVKTATSSYSITYQRYDLKHRWAGNLLTGDMIKALSTEGGGVCSLAVQICWYIRSVWHLKKSCFFFHIQLTIHQTHQTHKNDNTTFICAMCLNVDRIWIGILAIHGTLSSPRIMEIMKTRRNINCLFLFYIQVTHYSNKPKQASFIAVLFVIFHRFLSKNVALTSDPFWFTSV